MTLSIFSHRLHNKTKETAGLIDKTKTSKLLNGIERRAAKRLHRSAARGLLSFMIHARPFAGGHGDLMIQGTKTV